MIDLKEFHAALFDILVEFDRICRNNNIKYSLAFGTLLGAVRHKGFIPWDDDVDVLMTRQEFDRFCIVCNKELGNDYFLQSKQTEDKYPYNLLRMRKNNTAMIYSEWKYSGIHQGIYIDIYPYDNVPDNGFLRIIQKAFLIIMAPLRISRNEVIFKSGGKKKMHKLVFIAKNSLYLVCKMFPRKLIDKIEDWVIRLFNSTECKQKGLICEGGMLMYPDSSIKLIDTNILNEYTTIEFEGRKFMCIKEYKTLLSLWYGDYMKLPPIEQRTMFHNPEIFSVNVDYKKFL